MPRAYLRYAPHGDARPDPLADAVIARAVKARFDEIKAWLSPRVPASAEEVEFALIAALKKGGVDGFRGASVLRDVFNWPVDMDLCLMVRDTCNALAFALRVETRAWAVRVGLRFPGKDGEQIEWIDETERQRAGTILSTDHTFAAAIVQPFDGLIKAGKPTRVFAESVVGNISRGEYAVYQIGPPPAVLAEPA